MYILYGGDFTRAVLVQWVLEEGNLDYELRKIDIQNGEHRAAVSSWPQTRPAWYQCSSPPRARHAV